MNEIANIIETQNVRDINIVTTEINTLVSQAQGLMLAYAVEIGRRLCEAKSLLSHGEWGEWLKSGVCFSQSTANNYMRIFDEYGDEQITLFGAQPNSQAFGKLPYTKALKLLALPGEEREEFVRTNPVEEMSSRELKKAIKERNEARAAAEKAEREKAQAEQLLKKTQGFEKRLLEAQQELEGLKSSREKLDSELEKAKRAEKKAKEQLKHLKENPEIPEAVTQQITAQAQAEAAEKHKNELEKTIAEANRKIDEAIQKKNTAESSAIEMQKKYDGLLKKQKMSSPDVMSFKVYFEQAQEIRNKLNGLLIKIKNKDPETAQKLTAAMQELGRLYVQ